MKNNKVGIHFAEQTNNGRSGDIENIAIYISATVNEKL